MAEIALEDLLGTSVTGRDRPSTLLLSRRGALAHFLPKISNHRASLRQSQPERKQNFREIDFFGTINSNQAFKGVAEILRPRPEAANLSSAAAHEAKPAGPPYTPFLVPNLHEAPWTQRRTVKAFSDATKERRRPSARQLSNAD